MLLVLQTVVPAIIAGTILMFRMAEIKTNRNLNSIFNMDESWLNTLF